MMHLFWNALLNLKQRTRVMHRCMYVPRASRQHVLQRGQMQALTAIATPCGVQSTWFRAQVTEITCEEETSNSEHVFYFEAHLGILLVSAFSCLILPSS